MPERWQRELNKLRDIGPSSDLWARIAAAPGTRKRHHRPGSARAMTTLVAVLVASAGGLGVWHTYRHRVQPAIDRPSGSFISLPAQIDIRRDRSGKVTARAVANTNLPDGTKVAIEVAYVGGHILRSVTCCQAIRNGQIAAPIEDDPCYQPGIPGASGATVTFTVSPVSMAMGIARPGAPPGVTQQPEPPAQPAAIFARFGLHFERLRGAQVRVWGGIRELVASMTYRWKPSTCDLRYSSFNPTVCRVTQERLQGSDARDAMGEINGALSQARLCELWAQDLTTELRSKNPYPQFRDQITNWLTGLGGLGIADPSKPSDLSYTLEAAGPDEYRVQILFRRELIATGMLVHLPNPPGADSHIVPFWALSSFEAVTG